MSSQILESIETPTKLNEPIAYLVSRYPTYSHAFVRREVLALRRGGANIRTYSVRHPEQAPNSAIDESEALTTTDLLPLSPGRAVKDLLRPAARHPLAFARTMLAALKSCDGGFKNRLWSVFYVAEAVLLYSDLQRNNIRHVHAHFANVAADVAMWQTHFANAVAGAKATHSWSFTMHGPTEFENPEHFHLAAKVDDADAVLAISQYCRNQLIALAGPQIASKVHVVHCGLEPEFNTATEGVRDPNLVVTVGRLVPEKGQADLIKAFATVVDHNPQARLIIYGSGPDEDFLRSVIDEQSLNDSVVLAGAVSHDEIVQRLKSASVFCLPSYAEGLPVVFMEALAAGLAVVATQIAGVPEIIRDHETGLLVTPGDLDQIAKTIVDLLDHPDLRESLAQAGAQLVAETFDINGSAKQISDIFSNTLKLTGSVKTSPDSNHTPRVKDQQ